MADWSGRPAYAQVADQLREAIRSGQFAPGSQLPSYEALMKTYGVSLQSTTNSAKADWEVWAASLATNPSDFQALITPIYNYMNTSGNRQPSCSASS